MNMKYLNALLMSASITQVAPALSATSALSPAIPTPSSSVAPSATPSQPSNMTHARISFTMIPVADLARAEDFYTRALGMKVVLRPAGEIALNISGDIHSQEPLLFLKLNNAAAQPQEGIGIGLHVTDVTTTAAQIRASGYAIAKEAEVRVVSPPNTTPPVTMTKVIVHDPDGNIVELVQLR